MFEINIQLSDTGTDLFGETDTDFSISASHQIRYK